MKTTLQIIVPALVELLFIVSVLTVFTGCEEGFGIRGEGPRVTRELNLNEFDGISLSLEGTVYIKEDTFQEVIVKGQANILDMLNRNIDNGYWNIGFRKGEWARRYEDLEIFITVPSIRMLKISGSGKIIGENKFHTNTLRLEISGSGDISCDADATSNIKSTTSGSGNINVYGNTPDHQINISGSGNIRSFDLKTRNTDVQISGSGDAEVWSEDNLDVNISGSGSVRYKGYPKISTRINGSGKVKDAN